MKLCPTCRRCYEDTDITCPIDQAALTFSRPGSRTVADRYLLERLLGRGGMGAVYAGTHIELDRPCAIKLLLSDFTADADALERFRREARAAARLNHPNVADIYDYGISDDGSAYIVMELVEGQTLREYMNAATALPISEAIEIAKQVAYGVDAAHRSGIVHRDLKPSNIILARDHHGHLLAKVVDFGVAKLKEYSTTGGGLTSSGSLIGTPRYMSPEQCSGHETDGGSDIYSLGVITFEMIAGQPPFDAPTATAIAVKHIQQPPPALREFRPDSPAELEAFLRQVLDKDPGRRPPSAAEFALMLTAAAGEPVIGMDRGDGSPEPRPPGLIRSLQDKETDGSRRQSNDTGRGGSPTLDHSPAPLRTDPSVRGYSVPPDIVLETIASEPVSPPLSGQTAPAIDVDSLSVAGTITNATQARDSRPSRTAGRRRPLFIYTAAGMIVALTVLGFWLGMRSSRQSPQGASTRAGTAQTTNANQETPGTGSTETSTNTNAAGSLEPSNTTPRESSAELKTALDEWLASTNSRDLERHMAFYAPSLSAFYLKRNVPVSSVRAEKQRLFSGVASIDVQASEPEIQIGTEGKTATMRFRKSWSFSGSSPQRGEVIQELRWSRTSSGWKIVSERDLEVIRSGR